MTPSRLIFGLGACLAGFGAHADDDPTVFEPRPPIVQDEDQSIFAPRGLDDTSDDSTGSIVSERTPRPEVALFGMWRSDDVFRGIERFDSIDAEDEPVGALGIDVSLPLDQVRPFISVYLSGADDSVSTFREVRPIVGAVLDLPAIEIELSHRAYFFPNRAEMDTAEVAMQVSPGADAPDWLTPFGIEPIFLAAYDYDEHTGVYLQAGIARPIHFDDIGLSLTPEAHVAYVSGHSLFAGPTGADDGWQHWQVGLRAEYELNTLLNIPRRAGRWSLFGAVHYTDGIENDLRAETGVHGAVGLRLRF